jgi:hypothetical protein
MSFEEFRDRSFGVLVPLFLGYLLALDAQDGHIDSEVLVVVLAGYGTGLAAAVIRRLTGMSPPKEEDDDDDG